MRTEKGFDHGDAEISSKLTRHAQHFYFAGAIETVTGLDLERGYALRQQRPDPLLRGRQQFAFVGGARRIDRGRDAAAAGGNIGITLPFEATLEFVATITGINQVRMAIYQARRQQPLRWQSRSSA